MKRWRQNLLTQWLNSENRSASFFVIAQLIDLNIQRDDLISSWVIPLLSLRREIGIYNAVLNLPVPAHDRRCNTGPLGIQHDLMAMQSFCDQLVM